MSITIQMDTRWTKPGLIEVSVKTLTEAAKLVEAWGMLDADSWAVIYVRDLSVYLYQTQLQTPATVKIYRGEKRVDPKEGTILELFEVSDPRLASGYLFPELAKKHSM